LEVMLPGSGIDGRVRYAEHHASQAAEFFNQACRLRLEGMVSKRADAPYKSGRSSDWLKTKCVQRQEFVIGGWRGSTAPGRTLGSLMVGYREGGKLRYAGKVSSGFSEQAGRNLIAKLRKIERNDSRFVEVPRQDRGGTHWVDPRLVAEVSFTEWTRDGRVRHPSLVGLREDKDPTEITREAPADT
ncbi:MAG: bifunctional non-ous end joining protein LigD, partial [Rhodospirillaceae bacterium]|nr:bifunctional non-ous end joining protein LigD [Rhodospirillaceae bacterium]